MRAKATFYADFRRGTLQGPSALIGRLFANPKLKSWTAPPTATVVIGDPQRLRQVVAHLRRLGYVVQESEAPPG
ncbi:MAG: hypothetical protein KatS3mg131_0215 [Candidatus Tectimicrobiota bacterium]|nr:MAG: hypothetical protein KatS3mg131_0215 [Candidatus Tectomicrobia bacterium]